MKSLTDSVLDQGAKDMAPIAVHNAPTPTVGTPKAASEQRFKFDPDRHLARKLPSKVLLMRDLGYSNDIGVSPVAVSDPFQLFTSEAISMMREEIFKPEVQDNHKFSSNIAACQLRGYAKNRAPFTFAAWNHPETLAIISKIAGVELVPALPYEIGHINFSSKSEAEAREELSKVAERKRFLVEDEGIGGCREEIEAPIVGWHTDSYPFVCVLMLSDVKGMVGGETAICKPNGDVIKVRGPTQGCAVIMQGRYINHQAMRALGARERITSVTSFRPKSPFLKDDTTLRTVRGVSDVSELYYDYVEYRLQMAEKRVRRERETIAASRKAGNQFPTLPHKRFLGETIALMEQTNDVLVEESDIEKGFVEKVDLPDATIDS